MLVLEHEELSLKYFENVLEFGVEASEVFVLFLFFIQMVQAVPCEAITFFSFSEGVLGNFDSPVNQASLHHTWS